MSYAKNVQTHFTVAKCTAPHVRSSNIFRISPSIKNKQDMRHSLSYNYYSLDIIYLHNASLAASLPANEASNILRILILKQKQVFSLFMSMFLFSFDKVCKVCLKY